MNKTVYVIMLEHEDSSNEIMGVFADMGLATRWDLDHPDQETKTYRCEVQTEVSLECPFVELCGWVYRP